MRLCFYSDYLTTSRGGGERHVLLVALAAAKEHHVTIALPGIQVTEQKRIVQELTSLVGRSLEKLQFCVCPATTTGVIARVRWLRQFDGVFWVCDGSLPVPVTGRRYLHIQVPFTQPHSFPFGRWKLQFWSSHANTNSFFTRSVVEQSWNTRIPTVLWPQVDTNFSPVPSSSPVTIVSIGRFFTQLHAKRQDVLIAAFTKLRQRSSAFSQAKLLLIGAAEDTEYVRSLQRQAHDLPVLFMHSVTRTQLKHHLSSAQFYWHAAGFGVDEHTSPEKVEHFGISVAEAMAAGCIPLVVAKGGIREVLGNTLLPHCSWSSIDECVTKTISLHANVAAQVRIRALAKERVHLFTQAIFEKNVATYFSDSYYNKPPYTHEPS